MKHHARTVGLLGVLLASVAAAQATTTVTIGGRAVTLSTVTVGGKTYVSLEQLRAALAAPGGANQQTALEGCRNQWLFNGIWRMRVTGLAQLKDGPRLGWGVTVEWRNGANLPASLQDTGATAGTNLALVSGDTWERTNTSALVDQVFADVPQGGGKIIQYQFWQPDADVNKPLAQADKLIITVNAAELKNHYWTGPISYTTANPNFRVNLRCTK